MKQGSLKKFLLVAGGTGGHVFPAVALAEKLLKAQQNILILTDARGARFIPKQLKSHTQKLYAKQLRGTWLHKILALIAFCGDAFYTLFFLLTRASGTHTVVGFGGFMSFWPLFWGRLTGKSCALYQSDIVTGKVNRVCAFFVHRIFTSFPQTKGLQRFAHKTRMIGLVTRPDFKHTPYVCPTPSGTFRILITGGSQGAYLFSTIMPQAIQFLSKQHQKRLHITQQCRPEDLQTTKTLYKKTSARVCLSLFIENLPKVLTSTHVVIARSGTGTLGELVATGKPALLIPYPYAAGNHQLHNALFFQHKKAAWVIEQKNVSPQLVQAFLEKRLQEIDAPSPVLEEKAQCMHNALPSNPLEKLFTGVMDACLKSV